MAESEKTSVVAVLSVAGAQYSYFQGKCPAEHAGVAFFRDLTDDIRKPLFIPLIDRVLKDAQYVPPEIQERLDQVNLTFKVALPVDDSNSFKLYAPFLDRCCNQTGHPCRWEDIMLQFVKYEGGTCWVVWPEAHYVYRKCTCCSCALNEDCPVVGVCVESNYHTVEIVTYCPHILYSERFQKMVFKVPTVCRCQAHCPTPMDFLFPESSKSTPKRKQKMRKQL